MTDDQDGALSALINELVRLREARDGVSSREIERLIRRYPGQRGVSRTTIDNIFAGKTENPREGTIVAIAHALLTVKGRLVPDAESQIAHLVDLQKVVNSSSAKRPQSRAEGTFGGDASSVPAQVFPTANDDVERPPWADSYEYHGPSNTADHFARCGYELISGGLGSNPHYLQGVVAVSAVTEQSRAARRLFQVDFQYYLDRLADQKLLRKDGATLTGRFEWTPSTCIHYGTMKRREVESLIVVQVYDQGAVSVCFREAITHGTLEEALIYWIPGAWRTALHVTHLLGLRGAAHGATMLGIEGLPELRTARGTEPPAFEASSQVPREPLVPYMLGRGNFLTRHAENVDLVPARLNDTVFPFNWVTNAAFNQTKAVRSVYHSHYPELVQAEQNGEAAQKLWWEIVDR